ncbi:MAG: hypothetical protein ACM3MK_05555 [Chitinophagales bacterium]
MEATAFYFLRLTFNRIPAKQNWESRARARRPGWSLAIPVIPLNVKS